MFHAGLTLFFFLHGVCANVSGIKVQRFPVYPLPSNMHSHPGYQHPPLEWYIHYILVCGVCSVAQSCPTLCNPVDCSQPGSSVHGSFPLRILEWVTISFSRGSSRPRDRTCVSCLADRLFTTEPPGKPRSLLVIYFMCSSVCMSVQVQFIPPLPLLSGNQKFVLYICDSVSVS